MTEPAEYLTAGWALCAIPPGSKGPRKPGWNRKEHAITSPDGLRGAKGVGLCHVWSGTCAIDFDDLAEATLWLAERGVNVQALLDDPESVRVSSGRPNRAKLIYNLPAGIRSLPSRKVAGGALELRCGSANGLTVQDALPPTVHPDTGNPYVWEYGDEMVGDWRYLPVLPASLLAVWHDLAGIVGAVRVGDDESVDPMMVESPLGLSLEELRDLLDKLDPDMPYDSDELDAGSWLRVGMALHHETSGSADGLELWDAWSANGSKYDGKLEHHWKSFTNSANAITARWLKKLAAVHDDSGPAVLDPRDHMGIARLLLERVYTGPQGAVLVRHAAGWYEHNGCFYELADDEAVRCKAWVFLDKSLKLFKKGTAPFQPQPSQVGAATDALRAVTDTAPPAPCWLPGHKGPAPEELIAMQNGLLHTPTRTLHPHTPGLFMLNGLPFAFDGEAPDPEQWLLFLRDVWGDDRESIDALQEMFGYLLTPDTSQQKMFMLIGPKRSGKGTIGRVLGALLGQANVVGPTLGSLCKDFGLQPLISKLAAIIPDARLGRADSGAIVERLLMVSGEDNVTVDRKHTSSWSGRLSTRFVMMTNEIPRFADTSGALAGRCIVLEMTRSFYGIENLGLESLLMSELSGIFRWALEGRDRLASRGHFVQPTSAMEVVAELEAITSPMSAFLRDCCALEPGLSVPCVDLYDAWSAWCQQQGRPGHGSMSLFGRDVRAAVPGLEVAHKRDGKDRSRAYLGIGLRSDWGAP